ncbi:MAG: hypothetical protein WC911_05740 [Thermoleophilia bacterium]
MSSFLHLRLTPKHLLVLIVIAIGIAGCGTQALTDTGSQTGSQSTETFTSHGWPHDVETIERDISLLRNLPIKQDIQVTYLSRDQLAEKIKLEESQNISPQEVASDEKLLKILGLLSPGENLLNEASSMMGEEIAGYYDDKTRELKVITVSRRIGMQTASTVAHEITHALQDQSFNLQEFLPHDGTGNSDRDLARLALVEGDASKTSNDYMDKLIKVSDDPADKQIIEDMGSTFSYLEDQLEFPYIYGERFVNYIIGNGTWDSVDAIYARPPESSEQIMHPHKYVEDEQPMEVNIPDLTGFIGADWAQIDEDVVGEFDVRELLIQNLPQQQAEDGAAGWGGGKYRFYQRPDGSVLYVMLLEWDTEADTGEFFSAMMASLEKRYGGLFDLTSGRTPLLKTPDGVWTVKGNADYVLVAMAPDQNLVSGTVDGVMEIPVSELRQEDWVN